MDSIRDVRDQTDPLLHTYMLSPSVMLRYLCTLVLLHSMCEPHGVANALVCHYAEDGNIMLPAVAKAKQACRFPCLSFTRFLTTRLLHPWFIIIPSSYPYPQPALLTPSTSCAQSNTPTATHYQTIFRAKADPFSAPLLPHSY